MQLNDAHDIMRSKTLNRRKNLRSVQLPRISPISMVSLLYVLSLFAFHHQGFIGGQSFIFSCAAVLGSMLLFHGLSRLGLNGRFREPGLMLQQIIATLLTMLAVAYAEPITQIALVPFILITFSFGIFRLSTPTLMLLALACLGAYLGIILLHASEEGNSIRLRADLLQWLVLALTLPGMIAVGKQIENLRHILRATRYQLQHYEEKSIRDDLTGVYNRRQLQVELAQAAMRAGQSAAPFCICIIDVDHFKEINDCGGHLAGDRILREFARVARDGIRDSDVFGRHGGDEFMLILPETDLKGAVMHAERLRVKAHFLDFQKVLPQKHISLSIGVAQHRPGEKVTDLIARADAALYRAKQLGRNRVEWVEEDS